MISQETLSEMAEYHVKFGKIIHIKATLTDIETAAPVFDDFVEVELPVHISELAIGWPEFPQLFASGADWETAHRCRMSKIFIGRCPRAILVGVYFPNASCWRVDKRGFVAWRKKVPKTHLIYVLVDTLEQAAAIAIAKARRQIKKACEAHTHD